MAKRSVPLCVTEATVTLPDGTVKNLQNLSKDERELLSHHIIKSTFEAMGLKATINKNAKASII